ncbi:tetratricopeptide repeat protein [Nitrosomonadales bacterium]|nr:tetratricopeptide repeat protein [Nitrosomonadales bacterium]
MTNNTNLNELLDEALSLLKLKDFDKAIPIYEAILKIDSVHSQALSHLSIIFLIKKRYQEAIEMIHKLFQIVEPVIGDYQNLASAYLALNDYKNAIDSYEKAIQINPNISEIHKLLGDAQIKVADHIGAFDSYEKAYKLEPEKFQRLFDYGIILHLCRHHEQALDIFNKAQKIDPNHIECMNKTAACLSAIGDYSKAKSIYKKLMELAPEATAPIIDFASCLMYEDKYDEPIKILKEVLIKKPYQSIARSNLSLLYLTKKNFKEGWDCHEARIQMRNEFDATKRYDSLQKFFSIDVGKKELKSNEKIIILLDAGIGDVILGFSMLKDFYKKFKNISAEVDYRLVNLFKRSFPEINFFGIKEDKHEILINHNLTDYDKGIYWMSLGKYVRQNISDFPKESLAFMKPDEKKVNEIRNNLKKDKKIVCGVSWKSAATEDRHKSILLQNLIPIFSLHGLRFIDLQYEIPQHKGQTALEKKNLFKNNQIKIEKYKDLDTFNDIDGLSALIENCDIVVTASNVTAHIAGALGKKTFLFVPFSRGKLWYWHDEKGSSIWYPSIKIFRAESVNKWGRVFIRIAEEIKKELT